ncbi:MAG TPA: DUF411 domain-containing protein [Gemmatimonadales bacterium]|jgi:hypothetical protein|nr:DUF411 domain-containing protein [Gemmatimonadales bacterium]
MITRRTFVGQAAGVVLASLGGRALLAEARNDLATPIVVYKSASCGCCAKWVDHLRATGFTPTVHDEADMDSVKDRLGVPKDVRSCHTAVLGRYLIEGHVPAADLRSLLARHPAIAGLAVPGMPGGTPGMASPGAPAEPYEVLAFQLDGKTQSYARH